MSKLLKIRKEPQLKARITTAFMLNGKKRTIEKILLYVSKRVQKSTTKNFKSVFHLALINSTIPFEINEQSVKKGKRKSTRNIPAFVLSDSSRIVKTLKRFKKSFNRSGSSESFCDGFTKEILSSSNMKGTMLEKKDELQKQIIVHKRYLSRFRW